MKMGRKHLKHYDKKKKTKKKSSVLPHTPLVAFLQSTQIDASAHIKLYASILLHPILTVVWQTSNLQAS